MVHEDFHCFHFPKGIPSCLLVSDKRKEGSELCFPEFLVFPILLVFTSSPGAAKTKRTANSSSPQAMLTGLDILWCPQDPNLLMLAHALATGLEWVGSWGCLPCCPSYAAGGWMGVPPQPLLFGTCAYVCFSWAHHLFQVNLHTHP